jgi:two-component system, OmpR family, response regulator ChvI
MTSTSAKKRVLVVDDSSDITVTIKTGLEDTGFFQVDIFNDPKLALSSFKPGLYDLILIDFKMPKMYGHVLYDEIKNMDSKVKVCFLSATYSGYEAARKIFPMLEVECYIQKPVGIKDLVKRINKELAQ